MISDDADTKAAISGTLLDRGESVGMLEPLVIGERSPHRARLTDLCLELAAKAAGFRRAIPRGALRALADLVRAMNCYYSNVIEGHDTHPVDIERALNDDYSDEPRKRDLQREAVAHITVQRWIDEGGLRGRAATVDSILETHRRFGKLLPDELLRVENPDSGESLRIEPGALRERDVKVGRHLAVSPGAVPRFLERYESGYRELGTTESILATAAAHHRLLWIHPFLDGNGRVARLLSHAALLDSLETGGVWSVARGLARRVAEYKAGLANCDLPRRNDLDGRGHLGEEALAAFTRFFLETCLDQLTFMEELVQPERLRARVQLWVEEEARVGALPSKAGTILEAVLVHGELPRGDVAGVLDASSRHARRLASLLVDRGVLASDGVRAPFRLAFPASIVPRWLPGLFPDREARE